MTDPVTKTAAAVVIGAAHLRVARNGQDAVAVWAEGRLGVAVVCDGCGSAPRSELGALVVAQSLTAAMARQLRRGEDPACAATWAAARAEVRATLQRLLDGWCPAPEPRGERDERWPGALAVLEQHLLCTAIAAAVTERTATVWAVGDGAFVLDGELRVLGPFADNAPPYLAYDLLDDAAPAQLMTRAAGDAGAVLVATDGAAALGDGLRELAAQPRYVDHPDALRRHLTTLARPGERIVWDERRVERTAARLQDDAAVGLLRWGRP